MRISAPGIRDVGELATIEFGIDSSRKHGVLWYSVPTQYGAFFSDLCDGPVVGLLVSAMLSKEDIFVDGLLSDRLYHNVSGPYQALLMEMIPSLHAVKVFPRGLVRRGERPSGVATGFSAGVDSFSVVADYYLSDIPPSLRLTHILFNNVGSHGGGGEQLFDQRYRRVARCADRLGLPLIKVNSNLDGFYNELLHFERTHTLRNASVALTLQGGIGRFFYASAFSYPDLKVAPSVTMAHSDAIALPLLSTDSLDMMSAGSEKTRVEKTVGLADFPLTHDSLDVCLREGGAELLGMQEMYEDVAYSGHCRAHQFV